MFLRRAIGKYAIAMFVVATALLSGACAALQPTETDSRSNLENYPIGLADPAGRLEEASLAWYRISQQSGAVGKTEANLNPYTGTLQSLPGNGATPIRLPKVGADAQQTEEQTRESLRRFIVEWRQLIGADPTQLSLVERTDEPSGEKVARYEQKPFRYPLRGGFGNLVIRFRADRQVVGFSSNCIPNAERIQAALNNLTPTVTAEAAVNSVKQQQSITAPDSSGRQQTFTLPPNAVADARQLVVYAQPSPNQSDGLQLYLAWEIDVANAPMKMVYLDAMSDRVIAVS
jgi:hypothetical protein